MKPSTFNISKNERGATMVEAMFVLPILFATVFFIVWYSRSMHESNMMNEAMYRAGKIASTIPNLDLDLSQIGPPADINSPSVRPELKEFRRVSQANLIVAQAGTRFLTSVGLIKGKNTHEFILLEKAIERIVPDGNPSAGYKSDSEDNLIVPDSPPTKAYRSILSAEVIALLPSECASYKDPSSQDTKFICNNKVIDPKYSDITPIPSNEKKTLLPPKILLKQFPIKIVSLANREPSVFNGGGGLKEFNFYIVREPIPPGPFTQTIETGIQNGDVGSGVPPDPLTFGVPEPEGAVVLCDPAKGATTPGQLIFCSGTWQGDPCYSDSPSCLPFHKIQPS